MRFDPLAQSRLRAPRLPSPLRIFLLLLFVSSNITRLTELADVDRKRAPHFRMPTRVISLNLSCMSIYEDVQSFALPTTILLARRREFSDPRTEQSQEWARTSRPPHAHHVYKVAYGIRDIPEASPYRLIFMYRLVNPFNLQLLL